MVSQRWRPVWYCVLAVVLVWVFALTGYTIARNSQPTAEAVRTWMESINFEKLPKSERTGAIQKLANKLNALPIDERRRAQLERVSRPWFEQMTEEEKRQFVQATMPAGLVQMLSAFQQLPDDKRRRTIEDTFRRLRETQTRLRLEGSTEALTNNLPRIGELQAAMRGTGWVELYNQSPPQLKAELAPLLEEMQRVMESGRPFRGR